MQERTMTTMGNNESEPRRGGPRPGAGASATKTLGGVRVTTDEIQAYTSAAEQAGKGRAEWIRDTLNATAKRALRRRQS